MWGHTFLLFLSLSHQLVSRHFGISLFHPRVFGCHKMSWGFLTDNQYTIHTHWYLNRSLWPCLNCIKLLQHASCSWNLSIKTHFKKKHANSHISYVPSKHIFIKKKKNISKQRSSSWTLCFFPRPSELMIWDEAGVHVIPKGPVEGVPPPDSCVKTQKWMVCEFNPPNWRRLRKILNPETETLRFYES